MRSIRRRHTFDAFRTRSALRIGGRGAPVRVTFVAAIDDRAFDDAEVAFAIDRRFGTAVERNRARRRVRGALTQIDAERSLPHGAYLFRPNRSSLHCSFDTLVASVASALETVATTVEEATGGSDPSPDGERGKVA